jgi:hypothetical protein
VVTHAPQEYNREALRIFGNKLPQCPGCQRCFPEAAVLKDHMTACPAYLRQLEEKRLQRERCAERAMCVR